MAYQQAGAEVRRARERMGMTQAELADAIQVHQQTVSRWEAGTSRPKPELTVRLAQDLGVDVDELLRLFGHPPMTRPPRPVRPLLQHLPLGALPPGDFEGFCRDLLSLRHPGADVHRFGGQGHKQDGIDLVARFGEGAVAVYQCKQVKQFGAARVAAAVEATTVAAERKFLLLSRLASPDARKEMDKHSGWSLLDVEDVSRMVWFELPQDDARRLVDTYFPGLRQDFLGLPEPSIWLTPEQFFSPTLRPGAVLSHRWELVGRQADVRAILDFAGSDRRALLLSGPGGSGKSRLLHAAASALEANNARVAVRFIAPEAVVQPRELELLPNVNCLVIVDDAHDRDDIDVLVHGLHRVRPGAQILLATRPYGIDKIETDLRSAGLVGLDENARLELSTLNHEDVAALAREVLARRDAPTAAAGAIATATRDCPLFTVIGAELVAAGRADPASLASDETARSLLAGRFGDALLGDLGDPYERQTLRRLLELIALLQPVIPDDERFREAAAAVLDRHVDEIARHTRTLEQAGVLLRRGRTVRVVPDLLADFLVADACVDARTGATTRYADRVRIATGGELAQHLILNVAKLDWRVTRDHDAGTAVLDDIWASLSAEVLEAGIVTRGHLLKELSDVSYYQPRRALELARLLVEHPTSEPGVDRRLLPGGDITYDYVLDAVPQFLRGAGYHLDHLGDVADLLWQLGRDRAGPLHARPDNAVRILQDLAALEPRKALAFSEVIIERAIRWLDDAHVGSYLHSPFDVMETALATEGHTSQSRGWTVTMMPFTINPDAVRSLRQRVLAVAISRLYDLDLRVATRAAGMIEDGLQHPMGLFGRPVAQEEMRRWTPQTVRLLHDLRESFAEQTPDAVVQERLRSAVARLVEHGDPAIIGDATGVLDALTYDLAVRLTEALMHAWAHSAPIVDEEGDELDYSARETRWRAHQRDVATELVGAHATPADVVRELERRLDALAKSARNTAATPGPFIDILFEVSPPLADEVVRRVLDQPDTPLRDNLHLALERVHKSDGIRALDLATGCVRITEPVPLAIWVAAAYGAIFRRSGPTDSELTLLRQLARDENEQVRLNLARGLRFADALPRATRIELVLGVEINGSDAVADEIVGNFGAYGALTEDELTESQKRRLVDELLICADISKFQIAAFLSALSESTPDLVLNLLLRRIEYSDTTEDRKYHPIPLRWDEGSPLRFRETRDFRRIVHAILDWAEMDDEGWRRKFWSPHLFACAVRTYDAVMLAALDGWISTLEPHRLETVAHILREAPPQFVWDHTDWVCRLLEEADSAGLDCYASVSSSLHSAVVSGSRSGAPGEPFPEDVEQRDKAAAIARMLPPGRPAHQFFVGLVKSAESAIQWTIQRHQEDSPD